MGHGSMTEKLRHGGTGVGSAGMFLPRLLSTDFDGTLIHSGDGLCPGSLAEFLREHHQRGGKWAINTGRGLDHILEGLETFSPPVAPDFLLVHEREIYRREGADWVAYGDWNANCRKDHADLFQRSDALFMRIQEFADASDNTVTVLHEESGPVGLITCNEEVMEHVVTRIETEARELGEFSYQRNSIYLRFCHRSYHKGSALRELCRLENIPAAEVFAAGDHFNDLSMLDGTHAALTACPANAIEPVKDLVRRARGYIAEKPWAEGVAEALRFYENLCLRRDQACA